MTTEQRHQLGAKILYYISHFEAEIARDANDARAYVNMGLVWHWQSRPRYSDALEHYNMAVRLDPSFPHALCARASLLATCPDATYRDGASAVKDASAALDIAHKNSSRELQNGWQRLMYLQTLAAAHAEEGDFERAGGFQHQALEFTVTMGAYKEVIWRLKGFWSRQPVRERFGLVRFGVHRPSQDGCSNES